MITHEKKRGIPPYSSGSRWAVVVCVGVIVSACAAPQHATGSSTPMSTACGHVPTVEECQVGAMQITDECLRGCVHAQCAGIKIKCSEYIQKECKKNSEDGTLPPFGYVYRLSDTSCENPVGEINWCELPEENRKCRADAMVHELAHSCGWAHGEGLGVPSNDGFIQCD